MWRDYSSLFSDSDQLATSLSRTETPLRMRDRTYVSDREKDLVVQGVQVVSRGSGS